MTMTLKELIQYYETKAHTIRLGTEASIFRHTAELLRELRRLRFQIARKDGHDTYNKYNHMEDDETLF